MANIGRAIGDFLGRDLTVNPFTGENFNLGWKPSGNASSPIITTVTPTGVNPRTGLRDTDRLSAANGSGNNTDTGGGNDAPDNQDKTFQYPGDATSTQDAREKAFTIGQLEQQIAQLDAAIQNLGGYESSGLTQITDAYNKGMSRLNQQRSNALTRYNTQRGDTESDFNDASGDIDSISQKAHYIYILQPLLKVTYLFFDIQNLIELVCVMP